MARKITTEIFIKECEEKFGKGTFDYSKTIYKNSDTKVCIICPKHGEFWVTPSNLRHYKTGCPKCAHNNRSLGLKDFIAKSKEKFGDKFDYSKSIYVNRNTSVIIICPIHGEFSMKPFLHLNSPTGCPQCSKEISHKKLIDGKDRKTMREYRIWKSMKTRTSNLNSTDGYHYIVEKNIKCCDRWVNSFENFYEDMGPCPENYSLDRIDNDKDYCPENCRWASRKTQSQNRGDFNIIIEYNNEIHVLKEWSRILNIKYSTLYNRIHKEGLSFEEAIKDDPFNNLFEFKGEKKTLVEWCKIYNIKYTTVLNRLHKHKWTLEESLLTPYKHRKIQI